MALKDLIEQWLGGFASRDAAVAALEAERVPCAPVLSLHEAMAHPHLRERGTVRRVNDPEIGEFDIPGWRPSSRAGKIPAIWSPTASANTTRKSCAISCR